MICFITMYDIVPMAPPAIQFNSTSQNHTINITFKPSIYAYHIFLFLFHSLTQGQTLLKKKMALCRRPYAYSKVDKEDPEDIIHRRAQFLIHKVLEQADSRRKPSCLRIRISKMKVKIGKRLRRLRRRIMSGVSAARLGFHGHVMSQIKTWKRLFSRGRQSQTLITLPPLIK